MVGSIMTEKQDNVLTIEELAVYLKISKSSLYKLAQKGEIPGQKVGKHWRFRRDIIDQLLADSQEATKRKKRY
jgi:excisionase family DNA binding protein